MVRNYFEAIDPTYGDLGAEAKVPLPLDAHAPPVDCQFLLELERDGVIEQRFEKAAHPYNIRMLLDGVDERTYDVFLSHSSGDKPLVRELRNLLKHQGIRCWLDEEDLVESQPVRSRSSRQPQPERPGS